jgi:hypothetical protein
MAANSQPGRTWRLSAVMPAISVAPLADRAVTSGPSKDSSCMAPNDRPGVRQAVVRQAHHGVGDTSPRIPTSS